MTSITEDADLSLAMYPVENENERLKFLLDGPILETPRPEEVSDEGRFRAGGENLALIPWRSNLRTRPALPSESHGRESWAGPPEQGSSKALFKHLSSWMRRLDVLKEEDAAVSSANRDCDGIADATQFRDGAILCRLIQQVTGKRVLGGVQGGPRQQGAREPDKFDSLSNLNRGFQSLWSWLCLNDLHDFRKLFEFYPESIVKGNEEDLWSCIQFLYKVYLHSKGLHKIYLNSKGVGSAANSVQGQGLARIPPQTSSLMTAQAVFDRILGCTLDGLKEIVGGYWLDAMPLIGPAKKGKEERDFRNGSLLCQLMAVVDERSVYSSILNPTSYHPIFSRDNVAISLMALEQILLCEKIQKTQVSKVATTLTMERILDGDKTTTLRILALIKFALEWREGSFGSASAFFNPTAAAKQRTIIKKEATEAEKKVMRWLTRDLGLVEVGRTFAQALAKVRAGPLFARIAEKVSNKKVFGQIDQHPETKEAEDANVKKVFKNLERMPEISNFLSALQHKLIAGDMRSWLLFLEGLQRYHVTKKKLAKATAAREPKHQSRTAVYTKYGKRLRPERRELVSESLGLGVADKAMYSRLMVWLGSVIYVPKNLPPSEIFRDGRQIARLLQVLERKQIGGINWSPASYSAKVNNISVIFKFLGANGFVETIEFSEHQIARGEEKAITVLLTKIREWWTTRSGNSAHATRLV